MKKFILLLSFLFLFSCEDQNDGPFSGRQHSVIIDKGIYKVSYNESYEQPNWIEYTVSNRPKNVDRGNKDFYLEPGVHTSDDADYYKNEWDKGHLAPAADMKLSYNMMSESFLLSNISPQNKSFNKGGWLQLEKLVRFWGSNSTLYITTAGILTDSLLNQIGKVCNQPEGHLEI